jgi:hypothetical protein
MTHSSEGLRLPAKITDIVYILPHKERFMVLKFAIEENFNFLRAR